MLGRGFLSVVARSAPKCAQTSYRIYKFNVTFPLHTEKKLKSPTKLLKTIDI